MTQVCFLEKDRTCENTWQLMKRMKGKNKVAHGCILNFVAKIVCVSMYVCVHVHVN